MNHSYEDLHKLSKLKGSMQELYSNLAMRVFAYSIISVFVPIYLFYIGMSFGFVLFFFVMLFAFVALFSPAALLISERIGLKNTIVLSLPFSILFFAMLYKMGNGHLVNPFFAALAGGVGEALYFTALNVDFAINSKAEHRGYNIGALDSFFKSSAMFGPIFGAWVIVDYGFDLLFGFSILVLMLALIPALQVNAYRESFMFSLKKVFVRDNVRYMPVFFAYGVVSAAEWFLWPLFVFMMLSGIFPVALAVALVALGTAIFVGLFRVVSSRYSVSAFMKAGAIVYALTWLLRMKSAVAVDIYALSFLAGLVLVLVHIPFFTDTIERAKEKGVAEFIVFREVAVCAGRVVFFAAMLAFLLLGVSPFLAGFLLAAAASLVFIGA